MSYPESDSFQLVAPYYDLLMHDVPYRDWVRYLHELFEAHAIRPRTALDLACGTGTISELLTGEGLRVTGVDKSQPMIIEARAKAERKRLDIRYHVQDAAFLSLPGARFDLCVSLFDSLNYILNPADLASAIERVVDHLEPGGTLIFDVNTPFALANGFFDQDNTRSQCRLRYAWRSEYDEPSRICTIRMRFFLRGKDGVDEEFRETHRQYAYSDEQLRGMLARAGFERVTTYRAYTLRPARETSDRVYYVARLK